MTAFGSFLQKPVASCAAPTTPRLLGFSIGNRRFHSSASGIQEQTAVFFPVSLICLRLLGNLRIVASGSRTCFSEQSPMICRSVCCGAMTYRAQDAEGVVVLVTRLGAEDAIGDYVMLGDAEARSRGSKWSLIWWWLRVVLLCIFLCAAAVPVVIFLGPLIIRKVIVPVLNWEMRTFSRSVLVLLLFSSIALFPTFLLPSSPCMWIAGMTFGYGYGFLLIMAGSLIGMSLPFFVGSFFRHDLHRWLEKWPKKAAIIRLAGEGDWFHQFRAVVLLRISPFPYLIFNYAAVAANIKYGPYISGSAVGTVHEIFITIYSGRLIRSLADATNTGVFLSMQQIVYDAIGFCVAAAATAAITIYAKRALRTLQAEDELS